MSERSGSFLTVIFCTTDATVTAASPSLRGDSFKQGANLRKRPVVALVLSTPLEGQCRPRPFILQRRPAAEGTAIPDPLDRTIDVHHHLESGTPSGKIVLRP